MTRTGPLLFAMFLPTDVYFIQIWKHGAWSKQEMIDILDDNWPNVLERWLAKGAVAMQWVPSDGDVAKSRKENVNLFIQCPSGRIYCPPGLGSTTNGVSAEAKLVWSNWKRYILNVEALLKDRNKWPATLQEQIPPSQPLADFQMGALCDRGVTVLEKNSGVALLFKNSC